MIEIRPADPLSDAARSLIEASEAELASLYPPEERFALSSQQLASQNVWLVIAWLDDQPRGCGGLVPYDGYGELKRIFVSPDARGRGLSHAILETLETRARDCGLPVIRLETGIHQTAASALYQSRGYARRAHFGAYPPDGGSIFMEKSL